MWEGRGEVRRENTKKKNMPLSLYQSRAFFRLLCTLLYSSVHTVHKPSAAVSKTHPAGLALFFLFFLLVGAIFLGFGLYSAC